MRSNFVPNDKIKAMRDAISSSVNHSIIDTNSNQFNLAQKSIEFTDSLDKSLDSVALRDMVMLNNASSHQTKPTPRSRFGSIEVQNNEKKVNDSELTGAMTKTKDKIKEN